MESTTVLQSFVQYGAMGATMFFIIKPLMKWFMDRADKKDTYIEALIDGHFKNAGERHEELIHAIQGLPGNVVEGIKSIYPPETFAKIEKIDEIEELKKGHKKKYTRSHR